MATSRRVRPSPVENVRAFGRSVSWSYGGVKVTCRGGRRESRNPLGFRRVTVVHLESAENFGKPRENARCLL